MWDINNPKTKDRMEARKKEKELDREPFIALIIGIGAYGDAIIMVEGQRPAYVCRLDKLDPPLIPEEGELWLVQTIYRNRDIIILCPIRCTSKNNSQ